MKKCTSHPNVENPGTPVRNVPAVENRTPRAIWVVGPSHRPRELERRQQSGSPPCFMRKESVTPTSSNKDNSNPVKEIIKMIRNTSKIG